MPEPMGFYTDTTVCIGCKACEVACKEWNQLPATGGGRHEMSGDSYDNTRRLDGMHWRHVKFIEQFSEDRSEGRWLMMSDVCKHCAQAGCLEVCPTGAIIRTEFDTVVIQPEVYGLPRAPKIPARNVLPASLLSTAGAVMLALLGIVGLRKRRMDERVADREEPNV